VCAAPLSALSKLFFGIFMPVICFALLAVTMALHGVWFLIRGRRQTQGVGEPKGFPFLSYGRTALAFILFSYTSVAKTTFDYLSCTTVPGFGSILLKWPAISCEDAAYTRLLPLVYILLLLFVIGFPIFVGSSLFYLHSKKRIFIDHSLSRWGMLYENYREQWFFWEFFVLIRRLLLVLLTTLILDDGTSFQAITISNILILSFHMTIHPYRWKEQDKDSDKLSLNSNHLEGMMLTILIIISAILSQIQLPLSKSLNVLFSFLVFPAILFLIGYACYLSMTQHTTHHPLRSASSPRSSKITLSKISIARNPSAPEMEMVEK